MLITRTLTTYKAKACKLGIVDGNPVCDVISECEYLATRDSASEARKAFKAQGLPCPKGCTIIVNELDTASYGATLEDFLTIAQKL